MSKGAEIRERLALVRPIWRVGGPGGRDVRWNDASSVAGHEMTLIDENVEDIDFDRLGRADLVCLTGMSIQGRRLIEILEEVKARARSRRPRASAARCPMPDAPSRA